MSAALKDNANFRWLMSGATISMLGDQFTLIALPWLVLRLTGDPLSLGLVIALMGIPRAVFILLGGALVDRYSPKQVLMLTKYASSILLGTLTFAVLTSQASLPLVYALAFCIGLAQAFAVPAGSSMLPRTIEPHLLQAANGIMMGLRQLTLLAGPLLAALILVLEGGNGAVASMRALGIAFGIDCMSYLVSAWTLSQVKPLDVAKPPQEQHLLRSVGEGIAMVWRDTDMRSCFLYWGLVSFFVGGAMQVAMPLLAQNTLHDAAALGVLLGTHGIGTLIGMAASGMLKKLRWLSFGAMILSVDALAGVLLMPVGAISASWQGILLMLPLGLIGGFIQIAVFTWIQQRVPPQMMGRTMSIFMFIFMGLAPLSAASTGWVLQYLTLTELFAGGGALLVCFALGAWLFTPMRHIRHSAAG
ncbi:MFS transporter [Massilia sp. BJB1822]|uniref:MFS transporter n=1 Tax=Massilia sp. BJB1822 TaxID=2744470 RepID=UPI0015946954|nr:MFS transporter [Massilia sp. BJB1822]NVE00333.1 MFS transporter [Massilia sp. BJB1822]